MGRKPRTIPRCEHYDDERRCDREATMLFIVADAFSEDGEPMLLCEEHTDVFVMSVTEGFARALGMAILEVGPIPEW